MSQSATDLILYKKAEVLLHEVYPVLKNFPKAMNRELKAGLLTEKEVKQAVDSWLGHARHSNSYNLAKKIFAPYPYINVEGEMKFGERRCD